MDVRLLIPGCALTIQLLSFFCAIRLLRYSENRIIGLVFVLAIFLMFLRRFISLFRFFSHDAIAMDMFAEMVALSISLLILYGIILISRLLKSAEENKRTAAFTETLYRTLFNQSPDGVLLLNMKGEVVEFNEAANQQLGYTRDEFKTLRISDVDPVEGPAEIQARFEKILKEGKDQFAVKHTTKQGEIRDVLVITQRIELHGEILFHAIWRDITEQRRGEQQLISIMTAVDSASDAIGISDAQGRHFYQNKAFSDLFGYTTAEELEAAGGGPAVVNDPEVAKELFDSIMQGGSWVGELEMVTNNGRIFPAFERADAIKDHDGKLIGLIGIITDITERKKTEEALRESEDRFRSIFEEAMDGIMIADAETKRQLEANKSMCGMLGYTREELVGLRMDALHPKDSLPAIRRLFEKQRRGEISLVSEVPMLRKNGSVLYADINATSVILGGKQCLIGIFRDITERKQAEAQIHILGGLIDIAPASIMIHDFEGNILYANQKALDMHGYSREEFLSLHLPDLDVPESATQIEARMRQIAENGMASFEVAHYRKDHSVLPLQVFVKMTEWGGRTVLFSIGTDITERHLLEAEQLKTQKLEAVGTLAGGIAHDFNNLLQGLFGTISMAKLYSDQPAKVSELLDQAEKALSMSVNLTTQLLTFAKGGKPVRKKTDIRPLVEYISKFSLSGSKCDCRLTMPQDLWQAEADEGQFGQVIQNIILNASDAMPGGGTIDISAGNMDIPSGSNVLLPNGGKFIKLVIRDTGTGIPEEHVSRIFDPYFTTKQKGSGLGLATSYSIIKNHGGAIEVLSKPGSGTTFFIYLPAAETGKRESAPAPAASTTRKCKILVMDDEAIVLEVAKEMLMALGHDVEAAADGESAIEKYRQAVASENPFDIVILDLTIKGGLGGEETLKRLLALDPTVKAVVASGYSDNPVLADFQGHGFSAVLSKPYSFGALKDCLDALVT